MRHVQSDSAGHLVAKDELDGFQKKAVFGVETVAYTFLVWNLTFELRSVDNDAMRLDKIDGIKKKICVEHRVNLTSQMESAS